MPISPFWNVDQRMVWTGWPEYMRSTPGAEAFEVPTGQVEATSHASIALHQYLCPASSSGHQSGTVSSRAAVPRIRYVQHLRPLQAHSMAPQWSTTFTLPHSSLSCAWCFTECSHKMQS